MQAFNDGMASKTSDSADDGAKMGVTPRYEDMKVPQLKHLLKERGLPVSGRKSELIERLERPPTKKPEKAWQHSEEKKRLKRALLDDKSPIHDMSIEEVRNSDAGYSQYPKFEKYFKDLKARVKAEKRQVEVDDLAAKMHLLAFERGPMNAKGYPYWDTHPAKTLLEVDVANKLHEQMKPSKLRKTRSEYMEFPADVFRQNVGNEIKKQNGAAFWAYKRNKRGMKKYLNELKERSDV